MSRRFSFRNMEPETPREKAEARAKIEQATAEWIKNHVITHCKPGYSWFGYNPIEPIRKDSKKKTA